MSGSGAVQGRETHDLESATVWVSDFEKETLIDASTAFFLPTLGVSSPMGYGILAFEDEDRADEMAMELGGEVLRWDAVVALPVVEGRPGSHDHQ